MNAKEMEALVGRTIAGKFEIEALVGEGAMGAVYRARQTTLGTTLAVKVLHRELAGEPMFAARFLREAQAASRVDHPSSMRVLDFGEEPDGLLYIAMEYVDGRTLAKVLEEEGPLPVARIVDIASQALAALAVAHDLGVVHRDLKPENIMIVEGSDDEGRAHDLVKVCDFGVAKLIDGARGKGPSVTAEGLVVGTPEYMSPEQARGEALDARSDIYSMGVLLFQLMTGKVPFDSETAFGTALMHVTDEPTRPRLLNPRVDARLEAICLRAMKKRPEDRHASARELRAELRALVGDAPACEADAPAAEGRTTLRLTDQIERNKPRSGLVVAAVVLAAAAAAGSVLMKRDVAPPVRSALVQSAPMTAARPKPPAPASPASTGEGAKAAAATPPAPPAANAPASEPEADPAQPQAQARTRTAARGPAAKVGRKGGVKGRGGAAPAGAEVDAPILPVPGDAPAKPNAGGATKKGEDPADAPLPVFPEPPSPPSEAPVAPVPPPATPAPPSGTAL